MDITLPMIGTGMGIVLGGFGTIKIMSNAQTKATKEAFTKEFVTREKCNDSKQVCHVHSQNIDNTIIELKSDIKEIGKDVKDLNKMFIRFLSKQDVS